MKIRSLVLATAIAALDPIYALAAPDVWKAASKFVEIVGLSFMAFGALGLMFCAWTMLFASQHTKEQLAGVIQGIAIGSMASTIVGFLLA